MSEIVYQEESYRIVGACFEVYNEMGCGFLEAVYQECMEIELLDREIPFIAQQRLQLSYKKHSLKSIYIPDAICFDKIIVEIKSNKEITHQHRAQVHNYLKATGLRLGLIFNFGHFPKAQYERIVR